MRNLHKYYYKDYFSLQDVSIPMKNRPSQKVDRHLDYKFLLDDQRKKELENEIDKLQKEEKSRREDQREKLKDKISELQAQLSVNEDVLKKRNITLTAKDYKGKNLEDYNPPKLVFKKKEEVKVIKLKVEYPGLVTGIGIVHEAKIEGEFKLGVHFDWTYGMPVVYGSSVKGVLRNAFIEEQKKGKIIKYDTFFLKEITKGEWSQEEIKILFDAIFEGKDSKGNNLSIYQRDIFFDAVIVSPDSNGRILCSDSITPHGDNPLKNPNPITFLKIAPGCKLEFRFKLVPTRIVKDGKVLTISVKEKLELFKEILTTVGVGAKTNVGYGQLKEAR